jgi:hypothetical protein
LNGYPDEDELTDLSDANDQLRTQKPCKMPR